MSGLYMKHIILFGFVFRDLQKLLILNLYSANDVNNISERYDMGITDIRSYNHIPRLVYSSNTYW